MYYIIYRISNRLNGKIYIGKHQTKNLDDGYMGSGKYLRRSIAKYGIENFTKEVLYIFETENEMNSKEAELVTEEFCLREDTYNICSGGKGGFGYINTNQLSNVVDAGKLGRAASDLRLKEMYGDNFRIELSRRGGIAKFTKYGCPEFNFKGRKHSPESKEKISSALANAQKGTKNSQYGSIWITNGTINKKVKPIDNIPEGWYKGRIMN